MSRPDDGRGGAAPASDQPFPFGWPEAGCDTAPVHA